MRACTGPRRRSYSVRSISTGLGGRAKLRNHAVVRQQQQRRREVQARPVRACWLATGMEPSSFSALQRRCGVMMSTFNHHLVHYVSDYRRQTCKVKRKKGEGAEGDQSYARSTALLSSSPPPSSTTRRKR